MSEDLTPTMSKSKSKLKNLSKTAANVENDVTGKPGQVVEAAKKTYDEVADRAADAFKSFNASPMSYIRDYPVQTAIAGMVVGFILGTAISRRAIR